MPQALNLQDEDISKDLVLEFIILWRNEFDEILTEGQARLEIKRLFELMWLLGHPLPGEEPERQDSSPTNP